MIDFGSTYTKVVCVDLQERRIVLTDKFPSTVHTDARICLHQCFEAARAVIGQREFDAALKLSSSSAAGGLRMAVIGLSRTLSFTAGKNAAYGAGAKLMKMYYGTVDEAETTELAESNVEIVLLCGGYEMGNRSVLLHNARQLAQSSLSVPVIYAGNSAVAQEVRSILTSGGKECFLVQNIIPAIGQLNTADAEELIRQIFMKRITNMKGLSGVQQEIGEILMPTPAAVLAAGTLLSRGTAAQPGLGAMMMVDVGGATTDVYSFCENTSYKGAKRIGAAEPYAKRTVEGDMGMRESSVCIAQEVGPEALARGAGVTAQEIEEAIELRIRETSYLPNSDAQARIDEELARTAVAVSVRRHAGHIEKVAVGGGVQNQLGKNLTRIRTVIGTGGVIVNHPDPAALMARLCLQPEESGDVLVPRRSEMLVDRDYVFYAAGLLQKIDEDAALSIMKASIGR